MSYLNINPKRFLRCFVIFTLKNDNIGKNSYKNTKIKHNFFIKPCQFFNQIIAFTFIANYANKTLMNISKKIH